MKPIQALSLLLLVAAATAVAIGTVRGSEREPAGTSTNGEERTDVTALLLARPFRLDAPYRHEWRADTPRVEAGWVLVLAVDAELARPRQELEPVLYVGDQTAERVNHGDRSGRLVVIVPADVGPNDMPALDLRAAPIWYGRPELPERVGAARIATERALADERGVLPFPSDAVAAARARGGSLLRLADRTALHRFAARVVLEEVPEERELAESLLAPLVR